MRQIGVIGAGDATRTEQRIAERVGELIAEARALLICGGLGGVMEAACRGARSRGGTTLGIIPGYDKADANPYVDIIVATGMGHARNALVVATSDVLIAIGGKSGTLSEIALGLKLGKSIIGLDTWRIPGVQEASTPEEAVRLALDVTSSG